MVDDETANLDLLRVRAASTKRTKRFNLNGHKGWALCEHVYDGDTPHLTMIPHGMNRPWRWTCRMARIQAPEMNEEAGNVSRDALQHRILGKIVRVQVVSTGKYGRPVVEIEDNDGNVNDWMLETGHAKVYS